MDKTAGGISVFVLKAVGLVMAVAVVVANSFTTLPVGASVTLLGLGLFAIGLASLIGVKKPE